MQHDDFYMKRALELAILAFDCGEIPIGAVVVSPYGEIVGEGRNMVEQCKTQSRHAEVLSFESAALKIGDWRLAGSTLYVTIEPCMMCVGIACLSRCERIVFGAKSPLFGYNLDIFSAPPLYTKQIKNSVGGVGEAEAMKLMQDFFLKKRESGE